MFQVYDVVSKKLSKNDGPCYRGTDVSLKGVQWLDWDNVNTKIIKYDNELETIKKQKAISLPQSLIDVKIINR